MPQSDRPALCFAHAAYRLKERCDVQAPDLAAAAFQVWDADAMSARIGEAEIAVVSGLWDNAFLDRAPKLRFVQSISAGMDRFDVASFRARGVRLASAQGANERAVAEHAMALILAMARRLHEARDNQANGFWRPMQGEPTLREDEVGGKTLAIVGFGRIGARLARLAKAFDMKIVGLRRNPAGAEAGLADEMAAIGDLAAILPRADYVVLTCPLTPETRGLIDATALGRMKPGAILVNVARGPCVVEADLIAALEAGTIAGAALDVTAEEPLPASSALWSIPQVFVTPHTAGETRAYESNIIALLAQNVERLRRGEPLVNEIV